MSNLQSRNVSQSCLSFPSHDSFHRTIATWILLTIDVHTRHFPPIKVKGSLSSWCQRGPTFPTVKNIPPSNRAKHTHALSLSWVKSQNNEDSDNREEEEEGSSSGCLRGLVGKVEKRWRNKRRKKENGENREGQEVKRGEKEGRRREERRKQNGIAA